MRTVVSISGFPALRPEAPICALGSTQEFVPALEAKQLGGWLCHVGNDSRAVTDAGQASKDSPGVTASSPPHSLSLFIVQLGTPRKVQVRQGYDVLILIVLDIRT